MANAPTSYQYDIRQYEMAGAMPEAFDPSLMPEWDIEGGMRFRDGVAEIEQYVDRIHQFLKDERSPYENRWKLCREYYDMDSKLKQDKQRLASIFANVEQESDQELDLTRAALVHPIIFEAVQQQQARITSQLFGSGPRYVEMLGRQSTDVQGAKIYEEVANFQQGWQIPTLDIADDLVNGALVEGTGIVCRQWDFDRNCPDDECVDLLDYWFDPQGAYHHKDRWNVWRRYPTLGELIMLRQQGFMYFTDEDMEGALDRKIDRRARDYTKGDPKVTPKRRMSRVPLDMQTNRWHEIVALDIFMQREGVERWVYRANKLVVAILPNPVPKEDGIYRYPAAIYSPIRKKGSKYGDSAVYRMLDSQDMVNSISYMMMSNLARSSLGLIFGDPNAYQGDDAPKPGIVNAMRDPKENLYSLPMVDASNDAIQAITYIKRDVSDMISGISDPARGQQTSANQTASSVNQLIEQSNYRMKAMSDRGRLFRRDYDSIGLLLNQKYLAPTSAYRITDEQGAWRPVSGNDLFGVAGKDIMPTGYPIEGSNAFFTQQVLNEVAVVAQTGGDPQHLMRKYFELKYGGFIDVNQIYQEIGTPGYDPRQENEMMAQGMPVKVGANDDDWGHMLEHMPMILMLQQQGADPQMLQGIIQHFMQHNSRYQQIMGDNSAQGNGEMGMGTSGLNMQLPGPDPKENGEIEAQMSA